MRLNIFVGLEGTHPLLKSTLTQESHFKMFMGQQARMTMALPFSELFNHMFGEEFSETYDGEYSLGISRTGAVNTLLSSVLAAAPAGTRVWFFKSVDDTVSSDLYGKFLKSETSVETGRGQRVSGLTAAQLSDTNLVHESAMAGLTLVDNVANDMSASDWNYFNNAVFVGGEAPDSSSIMSRLYTKS
jgi:hypothetical protein